VSALASVSDVACENRAAIYNLKDLEDELYKLNDVVALLRNDKEKTEKKKEHKLLEKRAKEAEREEAKFWKRVKTQSDKFIQEGMGSD